MAKPVLTLYSVWERTGRRSIDPLGATESASKRETLKELKKLRAQFPQACLVKTERRIIADRHMPAKPKGAK